MINDNDYLDFFEGLDFSTKMGKKLVFNTTNYYVNGVTAMSQNLFPEKFIATLFGERHDQHWECKPPAVSLAEYVKYRVENNDNIKIMLEYNFGADPQVMGSRTIREIYRQLIALRKVDKIMPYDYRSWFLTWDIYNELYHGKFLQANDPTMIIDAYITPYFHNNREFDIEVINFDRILYDRLFNLRANMTRMFKNLKDRLLTRTEHMLNIREELKKAWQMVTDWFVLKELYKNNSASEYIFLGGRYHFDYIREELSNTTRVIETRYGSANKCINLKDTYQFNQT